MKRIAYIVCIVFLLLAGLVFSGCKDGVFEGSGGGGNLIILDRTSVAGFQLNGKWIEVDGVKGSQRIGFNPTNPRFKYSGRKLSKPLYDLDTKAQYTEANSFSFTVKVYENDSTATLLDSKAYPSVTISNKGSGVIDWTD